ncbi:MAG: biotin carboxylase N-terminal domain-containing protein [Lysobacterales bacterium]
MSATYTRNPQVFEDRQRSGGQSAWERSFSCEHIKPLIVCRGPVRKEAMDIFQQMGITHYGILLSEKDSIAFPRALAPELRELKDPSRIHRLPDYSGVDQAEREMRIAQIIQIANESGYNAIFAGYGFMAEEEILVRAIEEAGLTFIGPCSRTVRDAGRKDVAKRTALACEISVTPGVDNVSALALMRKHPTVEAMMDVAEKHNFSLPADLPEQADALAEVLLDASYRAKVELISVDELCEEIRRQVAGLFEKNPDRRLRLKAIGGGGGKGQRLLESPSSFEGDSPEACVAKAAAQAPEKAREIFSEVKATGPGDNKNLLIELNIDSNRHQEVQLLGNGQWCIALGSRDCSLQMHEQKLLELSVTEPSLERAIQASREAGNEVRAQSLQDELDLLNRMQAEAERFGLATGLDSVSTWECIVDGNSHYFMEMNTRIQVEHRVTELSYALQFVNPDDSEDSFQVNALIEAMTILAAHGERLPKPRRVVRNMDAIEMRLNATNDALAPHAGGLIQSWSPCLTDEIRDDQGISVVNPDTGLFMPYYLAGAYDSNLALLLTVGGSRRETCERLANVMRRAKLRGRDLETNLEFHYGLLHWLLANDVRAKVGTRFVPPYLVAVAALATGMQQWDLDTAYAALTRQLLAGFDETQVKQAQPLIDRKRTLVLRPLKKLFGRAHLLSGWISAASKFGRFDAGRWVWTTNPVTVLDKLYEFLSMDMQADQPPAYVIWDHDEALLRQAVGFYQELSERLSLTNYDQICQVINGPDQSFDGVVFSDVQAAHAGFQAGLEILALPMLLGQESGFFDLKVGQDLSVEIPTRLQDSDAQSAARLILAPPPQATGNQILSESGGMYYARQAPDLPVFIEPGDHFDAGDPLYVIEVMKMFNVVRARFSGTMVKPLVTEDGVVVKKGQPLFEVEPDQSADADDADSTVSDEGRYVELVRRLA